MWSRDTWDQRGKHTALKARKHTALGLGQAVKKPVACCARLHNCRLLARTRVRRTRVLEYAVEYGVLEYGAENTNF